MENAACIHTNNKTLNTNNKTLAKVSNSMLLTVYMKMYKSNEGIGISHIFGKLEGISIWETT